MMSLVPEVVVYIATGKWAIGGVYQGTYHSPLTLALPCSMHRMAACLSETLVYNQASVATSKSFCYSRKTEQNEN